MRALFLTVILALAACPDEEGAADADAPADMGARTINPPRCDDGLIYQVCDGVCRFLLADPANCGGCNIACVTGQLCCSGVCLDEAETGKGCI